MPWKMWKSQHLPTLFCLFHAYRSIQKKRGLSLLNTKVFCSLKKIRYGSDNPNSSGSISLALQHLHAHVSAVSDPTLSGSVSTPDLGLTIPGDQSTQLPELGIGILLCYSYCCCAMMVHLQGKSFRSCIGCHHTAETLLGWAWEEGSASIAFSPLVLTIPTLPVSPLCAFLYNKTGHWEDTGGRGVL